MRRTSIVLLAGLCVLTIVATPAVAHLQTRYDPNDSAGPFDIGQSTSRHGRFITMSMIIRNPWPSESLATDNPSTSYDDSKLVWQLDTTGKNFTDYFIVVDYRAGKLRGYLNRWVPPDQKTNTFRRVDAVVDVWRSGRRAFARVRRTKLRPTKQLWHWNAQTLFGSGTSCPEGCRDRAPEGDLYTHKV